jgi:hypothetical protein
MSISPSFGGFGEQDPFAELPGRFLDGSVQPGDTVVADVGEDGKVSVRLAGGAEGK